MSTSQPSKPLIAHVIYELAIGGMENGLVNILNHRASRKYRHAIICIKGHTAFIERLQRKDVAVYSLGKREGQDPAIFLKLYRLFRFLKPSLVHSRNIAALDSLVPSYLAGVRHRIHGEHGRDSLDPNGDYWKYTWLKRIHRPLVDIYIPMSKDLQSYLVNTIKVPEARVRQIYNGVDAALFSPRFEPDSAASHSQYLIFGTVGRLDPVKDQALLVKALQMLHEEYPHMRGKIFLHIVGAGPEYAALKLLIENAGLQNQCWMAGGRDDVPTLMREFDVFVLPSRAEGISNTLLEAMATALPVIATRVGGNVELVDDGHNGMLVPSENPKALALAMKDYFDNPDKIRLHGGNGLKLVREKYTLDGMVENYMAVYDELIQQP